MTVRIPDLNGFYTVQRNPISRAGVFAYTAKSIEFPGWEADPQRRIMVYRPPEELGDPETVASFRLLPWIDEHTMLGDPQLQPGLTPPEDRAIQGTTGEQVEFDPMDGVLYANLKVWGTRLMALIDAGKKQLSLGFRCVYEFTEGIFEGQPYQAIQRRIRGNHNATVMNGRMGPDVAVLDHFDFAFDAEEFSLMPAAKKQTLRQRILAKIGATATDAQILAALDAEEDPPADDSGKAAGDPSLKDVAKMVSEIMPIIAQIKADIASVGATPGDDDMEPVMDEATGKQKMGTDGKPMFAKKKAADAAPPPAAMDAVAKRLKIAEDTLAEFSKAPVVTPKTMLAEIATRDTLATQLAGFIGTFDHATMTLVEVAKYGAEKVGLTGCEGVEYAAVKAWLHDRKPPAKADVFALDGAAPATGGKSPFDGYLAVAA